MKGRTFKFNTTHALILLGILFVSSIIYMFVSSTNKAIFEFFTNKTVNIEYYYINGCPHCVNFDPVWKTVSQNPALNNAVDFKKIEISSNTARASKFGISSAPTIIAVRKSDDSKLALAPSESRTEAGFTAFVQNYLSA